MPTKVHAKVKVATTSGPYPGKLPVRTRTPEPAPRPRSVVRDILGKPEREPKKAEMYPGPKPPQRTRDPVPPAQAQPRRVSKSQTEPDMKKLAAGPKLPERTRAPEPPTKRRSSVNVKIEKQPSTSVPKIPERTRAPVPPPTPTRGSSVKKVLSILGRSSRSSSSTSVSTTKQGKPRSNRLGSEVWDDKGSGAGSSHRPRRRVSWYSFRASPSSNSLCDLSVCDMACGRHVGMHGAPSVPSLPSLPSLRSGYTSHTTNGYSNGYPAKPEMHDRQVMTDAYLLTPIESNGLGGLGGLNGLGLDLVMHEREQGHEVQPAPQHGLGVQSVAAAALSHLSLSAVRAPSLRSVREAGTVSPVSSVGPLPSRRTSLLNLKHAEDITVTLWTRDGAESPDTVPCETDSESEAGEEPAVTIFPRGSSRLSRTPSVVISEHAYDFGVSPARAPPVSASARSRFSTASGYSTAMSGYSTAFTSYSTACEELPTSPVSPASATSDGFGNYNLFGAAPVTTSYNQFAGYGPRPPPPHSAAHYTTAGRRRPKSWHVSSTPSGMAFATPAPAPAAALSPAGAAPERDAKFLQPPDMHFVDDLQPVGPTPSVELDMKPGFRVEFDEARRGRPF